jgi:hypothetical protein
LAIDLPNAATQKEQLDERDDRWDEGPEEQEIQDAQQDLAQIELVRTETTQEQCEHDGGRRVLPDSVVFGNEERLLMRAHAGHEIPMFEHANLRLTERMHTDRSMGRSSRVVEVADYLRPRSLGASARANNARLAHESTETHWQESWSV